MLTNPFYLDDDEAREDPDFEDREEWMREREAFERPPDEEDYQLDLPFPEPIRFYVDSDVAGLPVVKDRLYHDSIVMRFITLGAATNYALLREAGFSHLVAWFANQEAS